MASERIGHTLGMKHSLAESLAGDVFVRTSPARRASSGPAPTGGPLGLVTGRPTSSEAPSVSPSPPRPSTTPVPV
eukprot:2841217-Pyramimonas_sp.AAC.1